MRTCPGAVVGLGVVVSSRDFLRGLDDVQSGSFVKRWDGQRAQGVLHSAMLFAAFSRDSRNYGYSLKASQND